MGRVILVNNKKGIGVRMWKGYRDAQCGWIEVTEERDRGICRNVDKSGHKALLRTALFLVIYAPKKGVIDIWSVQQKWTASCISSLLPFPSVSFSSFVLHFSRCDTRL